ncbi:signal peptidase I [Kitasatospora aburaviensis]
MNAFVARPFSVPSASMENSLRSGDRLVANKLAYAFGGHPERGDVVVFDGTGSFRRGPAKPTGFGDGLRAFAQDLGLAPAGDSVYVKRVIGVGGDRVTSTGPGGRITVNGVPIDESSYLAPGDEPSNVAFDVVVPAGKLWVMGDHRSASRDSRDHLGEPGGGFVPEGRVIGRADWVVYPIGHWTGGLDRSSAFAAAGGAVAMGTRGRGRVADRPADRSAARSTAGPAARPAGRRDAGGSPGGGGPSDPEERYPSAAGPIGVAPRAGRRVAAGARCCVNSR